MSKIIYVCVRDPLQAPATALAVATIARRLVPDNLGVVEPQVIESGGIVVGISTPNDVLGVRGSNIAAGFLVDAGAWELPRSGRPDGAYALFRSDDAVVEIVADTLASRTVWYVLTDKLFIASTSQRAIVALLRSFEFNPAVVPWMLATGTLGPGLSWDKRIRHVAGATTVALDRRAWTVVERTELTQFMAEPASDAQFESRASDVLRHVVAAARVGDPRWAITLSGGVDCRVILSLLQDTQGLRAVTWGLRDSLDDPMNDAQIARRLAHHFGLEHQYFQTDLSPEPVDRLFDRYVANGEGRVDHVSGYMDGFRLWRQMVDSGICGIVRGDQAFGHKPVRSALDVRTRVGLSLWSDFGALPPLERFGLQPASLPDGLQLGAAESLETWRDRLQQQFRQPFVLGGLSDLKLPYVEIINPLLSNSIIAFIRQLPDALRTNKALLRRYASALSHEIPFASTVAIQAGNDILRSASVVELLADSLSGRNALSAIPEDLASYVTGGLTVKMPASPIIVARRRLRRKVKNWVHAWSAKPQAKAPPAPVLDHNRIAFRAFLVERTTRLLQQDADFLS